MSVTIFDLDLLIDDVLTNGTAAIITITRTDTDEEIVTEEALTNISTGNYQYSLTDPALDLTYEYVAVFTYDGEDYTLEGTQAGNTTQVNVFVTLAEAKRFCRIASSGADDEITLLLAVAKKWVCKQCGVALATATKSERFDGGYAHFRPVLLPLVSVTSVTDSWTGDVEDSDDYRIDGNFIIHAGTGEAPSNWAGGIGRWSVVYVAGYNDEDGSAPENSVAAPVSLKLPILLLVRRAYSARGVTSESAQNISVHWEALLEGDIQAMIDSHRLGGEMF